MVKICCSCCHVLFYLTKSHDSQLRSSHDTFYCPAGHAQWYPHENDADRVEKFKKLYSAQCNEVAKKCEELKAIKRKSSYLKGRITKLQKEVKGGQFNNCELHHRC